MNDTSFGVSIPQDQVADPQLGLPDGDYPLQLSEAERKVSSKDANNWYIAAKFKVMAGPAEGRVHFENYNVGHGKDEVKSMALTAIKMLSKAVGYTGQLGSMDPYYGKPFTATIKNTPRKDKPDEMNTQIRTYKPISAYSAAPKIQGSFPAPLVAKVAPVPARASANDSLEHAVELAETNFIDTTVSPRTVAPWGAPKAT